jgi:hypothetical protein
MACELRRGEDLRNKQLWGPLAALQTAELGVELVVFEHSAGETQPICGLRPKGGTVPSRRHCLKQCAGLENPAVAQSARHRPLSCDPVCTRASPAGPVPYYSE